jgi:hypothetical protein
VPGLPAELTPVACLFDLGCADPFRWLGQLGLAHHERHQGFVGFILLELVYHGLMDILLYISVCL